MGSFRFLALLGLISLACAAAPLIPQLSLSVRGGACETCQEMVDSLEDYVTDPQTQAEVSGYIDANVCAALPASMEQACVEEVTQLVAAGVAAVTEALVPADLCTVLGACAAQPSTPALARLLATSAAAQAAEVDGPLDCPVCKMIIMTLVQRLEDPKSRREIEEAAFQACDNLPEEEKARCRTDVEQLFQSVDNLLRDVDPEAACELLQFCSEDPAAAAGTAVSPTRIRGAAAWATVKAGLLQAFSELAATPRADTGTGEESCDSCKQIVAEAAAILQDPKTQAEVMAYAKEGCAVLQDYKDQCEAYVTLYGPLVFNMALSYLQPGPVCARLGYCAPAAAA